MVTWRELFVYSSCFIRLIRQGFWRGNVPALLLYMPYTAIQFTVLHKMKTFAAGSSKSGMLLWEIIDLPDKNLDVFILFLNCYNLAELHAYDTGCNFFKH